MRYTILTVLLAWLHIAHALVIGDGRDDLLAWARDDVRFRNAIRRLDDNTAVAQPDEICAQLNQAQTGIMTCTCERFGTIDVKVFCTDVGETCNSDQSSCFIRTVELVVTSNQQSRVTTSCTNSTTAADLVTCVQVFPGTLGNFGTIQKCAATLNGDLCSSCTECVDKRNPTTNTTSITVNCCNVKEDAIQTCAAVGPIGSFLSYYDDVPAGSEGTCPSGAEQLLRSWVGLTAAALTSAWLLLR
ncbi:hypothetical protein MPSEU_000684800 [Mayamaea pseudoterrestris]|nr:hypothetical protein MPSEU_000684800 [Mayamaea pseudoterrestris]